MSHQLLAMGTNRQGSSCCRRHGLAFTSEAAWNHCWIVCAYFYFSFCLLSWKNHANHEGKFLLCVFGVAGSGSSWEQRKQGKLILGPLDSWCWNETKLVNYFTWCQLLSLKQLCVQISLTRLTDQTHQQLGEMLPANSGGRWFPFHAGLMLGWFRHCSDIIIPPNIKHLLETMV